MTTDSNRQLTEDIFGEDVLPVDPKAGREGEVKPKKAKPSSIQSGRDILGPKIGPSRDGEVKPKK
jgi:hypothetical protein